MLSICQLPTVKKGDAPPLRQLINHVSSHINAIQALSLNVPVQDLMLNHLMLGTLDPETREWELITASRADTPMTTELVTFLESRRRALELLQNIQSLKTTPTTVCTSQVTGHKFSKLSYSNVATQLQCPLCNWSHTLFKCEKFLKTATEDTPQSCQAIRTLLQLLVTFYKESHMLKTNVSSM